MSSAGEIDSNFQRKEAHAERSRRTPTSFTSYHPAHGMKSTPVCVTPHTSKTGSPANMRRAAHRRFLSAFRVAARLS